MQIDQDPALTRIRSRIRLFTLMRIQIRLQKIMRIYKDPDPQHCMKVDPSSKYNLFLIWLKIRKEFHIRKLKSKEYP